MMPDASVYFFQSPETVSEKPGSLPEVGSLLLLGRRCRGDESALLGSARVPTRTVTLQGPGLRERICYKGRVPPPTAPYALQLGSSAAGESGAE